MKDKKTIIIISAVIVLGLLAYYIFIGSKVAITGLTLKEHDIKIFVGDNKKLDISIIPENATDKTILWESDNNNIASVSNEGIVTGVSHGSAVITAKTKDGTISDKCIVKSFKKEADELTIVDKEIEVRENDLKEIDLIIEPSDLKEFVKWTSSDEKIVTVEDGVITGKSIGKTTVTAQYGSRGVSIVVRVVMQVDSLKMEKESTIINVNNTEELKLLINPESAANQEIKWESSNTEVATVENGKVTGIKAGTANITASVDGKTATCVVTVSLPVSEIKLNKTSISLKKGNTDTLVATISPSNATNQDITWTSSNEKVATVDKNGKVTGIGTGKATIEATVDGKTAKCNVTSIGYVITEDSKYKSDPVIDSYNSETFKYRITKPNGHFVLIWVMDAYKQWNSGLPKLGTAYAAESLLSQEISKYGYQKKGLVATNGGFFWDGWGDSPCVPFILNKGKIIRDIENKDYKKRVYGVLGMTKDSQLKTYSFTANDYSRNSKSKQEMLDDGVRNSFSFAGTVISKEGKVTTSSDKNNRTVLCQIDENNFVIYSGGELTFGQIGRAFKDKYNCKVAYNFDGGGSRKLYYKTGSMSEAKKVFGGSRAVPDMMYFVEQ